MYDLFYDGEKKKFYIISDGTRTYISTCNRVTASFNNGNNRLFGGIICFSKNINKNWYIINDIGNNYIPLCSVSKLELL